MNDARKPTITPVRNSIDLAATAELFKAYVAWLDLDLTFQDYHNELESLPGKYAPPAGELLLARNSSGRAVGCVAVRSLDAGRGCCEMKRLYVAPEGRSLGLGKALMDAIVGVARALGYQEMKLDTLPRMFEAVGLYKKGGFVEVEAYYQTPIPDTMFLGRNLEP